MTSSPTVAFLGTGTMGLPMARNLLSAGIAVRAWNRTPGKAEPLAAQGASVHATPAEASKSADVLLTMLYDASSVAAVAPDALDALDPDALWLQMSTVGLAGTEQLAAMAGAAGITYVDAPVVGTKAPAEQGTLTVLASGPDDVRGRCMPVFDAVGARTVWVDGPAGGTRLKLVANSWVLALNEAVAEAVALSRALDLDPQLFLDTLKGGPTDAAYAHLKGGMMISRSFPPSFALDAALKDAGLILEVAVDCGVGMPATEAAHRQLARASGLGHGDADMAATYLASYLATAGASQAVHADD